MSQQQGIPSAWQNPVHFLACGFGSGNLPLAPGTFGTLAAIPLYLLIADFHWLMYLLVWLAVLVFGVWCCGKTAKDVGLHDHASIVWDEIAGYLLVMFLLPPTLLWMLLGFVLFRFFDILKPWPIRWLDQHVKGGWGIMLDDVLAGVYAFIIIQLCFWYKNAEGYAMLPYLIWV